MKELIIHCPTKDEYIKVDEKLSKDYNIPKLNVDWNSAYGVECCIYFNKSCLTYANRKFFEEDYSNIPITSAQEFLGEDKDVVVRCITQRDWNDVCLKIAKMYPSMKWRNRGEDSDCWNENKRNTCIRISTRINQMGFDSLNHYKTGKYRGYTDMQVILAKDFLNSRIIKHKQNKLMSVINNVFKSKENKALEHFGLGSTKELTDAGRKEFVDFLFETMNEAKKAFLVKIAEAHKEATK